MLPILTPTESAALDRASEARGVSAADLMEKAGWAVARQAMTVAGGAYGRRAAVVCGKGNNGGDGLAAARRLDRWGMGVTALLVEGPAALSGPARASFSRYVEAGGRWRVAIREALDRELSRADVVVDAVFGTGFRGRPRRPADAAIEAMAGAAAPIVAVDIPSGVEGEAGGVLGRAVRATVTVTLGALKPGLVLHPGAAHAGEVVVADIGFPSDLLRSELGLIEASDVAALLPPRDPETHKRAVGAVLVVAGSRAMTGAAVLAATAAYRAGAGLVTLAVPEGILGVVESAITEATFLPLPETREGSLSRDALGPLEERLGGAGAAAVGPGLTTHPDTADLVRKLVASSAVPLVLDADGLNAFEGLGGLLGERPGPAVLTPHAGEFGRLMGLSSTQVVEDRVGRTRAAAAEFRSVVVLKGSRTVVAEADGRAAICPTGGPYLATGGTGDVLTGAVAAYLARGMGAFDAAMAAAFVHGMAGRLAFQDLGAGTMAGDVAAMLPEAMRTVSEES